MKPLMTYDDKNAPLGAFFYCAVFIDKHLAVTVDQPVSLRFCRRTLNKFSISSGMLASQLTL